ncbi:MAG TPA: hypothetical protein VJZ71_12020 [Phycisphaerae bacterium]|nr:hypothetical protein [Phycisphaerae bacterium]
MVTHMTALLLMTLLPFDDSTQAASAEGAPLDKTLAEVSYLGEDLDDAISDWAEQAGVNVVPDWPALEALGIFSDTRIDLSLKNVSAATALHAILNVADQRHLGASYELQEGIVTVTSAAVLDRRMEVRTYDCAALLQSIDAERPRYRSRHHYCLFDPTWRARHISSEDGPQSILLDAIESTIAPESWDHHGGPASSRIVAGKLVVRQTRDNHYQIARLLHSLSASDVVSHVTLSAP